MADSSISEKLTSLGKSKFRSKFKLSQKDRDYITTKGLETIKDHAYQFINARVAPAFPKNDGKQTPMKGASSIHRSARNRHLLSEMYPKMAWIRERCGVG
jgi:hypothetical protein